jgi:isocitrate lyase
MKTAIEKIVERLQYDETSGHGLIISRKDAENNHLFCQYVDGAVEKYIFMRGVGRWEFCHVNRYDSCIAYNVVAFHSDIHMMLDEKTAEMLLKKGKFVKNAGEE